MVDKLGDSIGVGFKPSYWAFGRALIRSGLDLCKQESFLLMSSMEVRAPFPRSKLVRVDIKVGHLFHLLSPTIVTARHAYLESVLRLSRPTHLTPLSQRPIEPCQRTPDGRGAPTASTNMKPSYRPAI